MDKPHSEKPVPGSAGGGSAGDLWKKVLDEVQVDAAARRSKAVARTNAGRSAGASAGASAGVELDLLKRILTVIEARPSAEAVAAQVKAELLPQVRVELAGMPKPKDLTPELVALAQALKAIDAKTQAIAVKAQAIEAKAQSIEGTAKPVDVDALVARVIAAVEAKTQALDARAASLDETTRAIDAKAQAIEARAQSIEETTKAIDAKTQAIEARSQAIEAKTEGIESQTKQAIEGAGRQALSAEEIAKLVRAELAALPRSVDLSPQIEAVTAALKSLEIKAAETRPQVAADGKLDELLAAVKHRPDDGRDEVLLQILESVQKPAPVYHERFDQLLDRINALAAAAASRPAEATPQQAVDVAALRSGVAEDVSKVVAEQRAAIESLREQLKEVAQGSAGLAQQVSQRLDAIAADDRGAKAISELQATVREQPRGSGENEALLRRILEIVDRPATPFSDEAVREQTKQLEALRAEIRSIMAASPAGLADQIRKDFDVRTQAWERESADLRKLIKSDFDEATAATKATSDALLREVKAELDAKTQAVSERVKSDVTEAVRRDLGEAIAAMPKPVDVSPQVEAIRAEAQTTHEIVAELAGRKALSANEVAAAVRGEIESVRGELAAVRGELANQPKPADLSPQLAALNEAVQALPGVLDSSAQFESLKQTIAALPKSSPALDVKAVAAELRALMPERGEPVDAKLLARQEEVLREVLAAINALPAIDARNTAGELRTQLHALAESQRAEIRSLIESQQAEVRNALEAAHKEAVTTFEAVRGDARAEADAERGQVHALIEAQRQAQQRLERMIEALGAKMEGGFAAVRRNQDRSADVARGDAGAAAGSASIDLDRGYAWRSQPPPRNRTPAVAMVVTAVAAVGMFIVLLINSMNNRPANTDSVANNDGKTVASNTNTPSTNDGKTNGTKTVALDNTSKNDASSTASTGTGDDKTPGSIFHDPTQKGTGKPVVSPAIASEISKLGNPGAERQRPVYELAQAKQIVFLVHASGGSPTATATILAELKRTLAQVKPTQKFTVVFSEGKRFIEAPPNGLRDGGDAERTKVEDWIDLNIRGGAARGAANPLVALDVALSYGPDLLWILSDGIAGDNSGQVSSKDLLDRIAALNPQGATRIAGTQVGPADAGQTLKTLAEKYQGAYVAVGDGASAQRP